MAAPVTFLILGGAGDLARRLLIPGIAEYLDEHPETGIRLIGSGRSPVEDYPRLIRKALSGRDSTADAPSRELADHARYLVADATDATDLQRLIDAAGTGTRLILYFALSPAVTAHALTALAGIKLPDDTILAMEKPFGEDADSAAALNRHLLALTDEDHIFRVDHFIFETAVSNLLGLVGANALFSAGWHREAVAAVTIHYEECLGLEGRADFYDGTGAVRDMLQSHLLQVMAHALAAGSTDTTTDILAATRIDQASVRRARYTAGRIDGRDLPAYTDEEGVDPDHGTETLFQLTAWVDAERWRDVPVTLRSGKAIGNPRREIIVTYHRHGSADELDINPGTRLIFPFTDDVAVEVNVSDHGYRDALQRVNLSSELVPSRLSAYGRVVRALAGADTSSEVAAHDPVLSWEVIAPVLDAFTEDRVPLEEYPAGSRGPQGW